MSALDLSSAKWRKSTRSGTNGDCVEVAENFTDSHSVVLVRDSKNPAQAVLSFTVREWGAFLGGVHNGEFDL